MSKQREREERFAKVWKLILTKESQWNIDCLECGFVKIPPVQAINNSFRELGYHMDIAYNESPKLLKFLIDNNYITIWKGGDRNSITKGFRIEKRTPLPVSPEKIAKPKPVTAPSITPDDVRRIVQESEQRTLVALKANLGKQVTDLRALLSPRVRNRPNIVVLFDTANFGIGCDKLKVKMPIQSLFDELAKIGNVISSWAFYNDSNCPEYVKKVFAKFRAHLVACLDNKNKSEPEQKTTEPDGKTTIVYKAQTDWIDAEMERFAQDHLQFLEFDIAVFVSGDKHFEPVQNKMRQFGRKVMRCVVDEVKKQIFLWGEDGLVATLRTERR